MKQYVIDELRPADHIKVKAYLTDHHAVPGFEGLFHIYLADELLTEIQKAHIDCRPYYFALELLPDRLTCELLVRTPQRISCQCIQYATERQRNWFIQEVDAILQRLKITI